MAGRGARVHSLLLQLNQKRVALIDIDCCMAAIDSCVFAVDCCMASSDCRMALFSASRASIWSLDGLEDGWDHRATLPTQIYVWFSKVFAQSSGKRKILRATTFCVGVRVVSSVEKRDIKHTDVDRTQSERRRAAEGDESDACWTIPEEDGGRSRWTFDR